VVTGGSAVSSPISPPTGQAGNSWTAVSLNPSAGTITPINTIGPYSSPAVTPVVTPAPAVTPAVAATPAAAR
jgi:hypothetical protein